MPLTSIFKTIIHIYCSSILFNTIAPAPLSDQAKTTPSNSFPVLFQAYAEMTPTTPPDDRGSGR